MGWHRNMYLNLDNTRLCFELREANAILLIYKYIKLFFKTNINMILTVNALLTGHLGQLDVYFQ